ncbi:MAG: 30S ribosome-binding factor RbfA [Bacteroidales bacterium]
MESTRQNKISRLLQKDLGEILRKEGSAWFGKAMITVTKVNVTKDLSIARVYVSLFATADKNELLNQIRHRGNELRFRLGKQIGKQVRIIPELQFFLDDSLDYIERIENLLDT